MMSDAMDGVIDLDATSIAGLIRDRLVSPVDVTERFLSRIREVEPALNASCEIFADEARAAAASAERAVRDGVPLGPLHGVPVAVKESLRIEGKRSTGASRAFADVVATEDDTAVARIRGAGAIILLQTTMSELGAAGHTASTLFGVTRNPWNLSRSPGGSSGGSAAAVASHMVPIALGTDAGGSVRKPAAFCGIAGFKPTFGRIPLSRGIRRWQTFATVGPLAKSVRDLRTVAGVLSGPDVFDPSSIPLPSRDFDEPRRVLPGPLRVAWSSDLGFIRVQPGVRLAFEAAIDRLSALDWDLQERAPHTPGLGDVAYQGLLAETGSVSDATYALIDDPEALAMFDAARDMSAVRVQELHVERARITRVWEEFLLYHDVLLTPTVGFEAPPADSVQAAAIWKEYSTAFSLLAASNLTGQPAVTVPIGLTDSGLPVGLQVIGRRGADALVLDVAALVEAAAGFLPAASASLPVASG